ncbi:MAG: integrase arm-type DNA-binding domain-containing protein [Proteobacteria bacterium]|nr:integrase arm-type DNA-binding domain-containing protein [Pseudomonadota bacterium]
MKIKLTKRSIDAAKPGARDLFLWDTEAAGFGCKVTPKGRRVFILQYWANGRARRVTLGRYGSELTVDQARTKARRLRGHVADGGDPAGARAQARAMPTVKQFAERYLREYAAEHKRPSSCAEDARNVRNHVAPLLGDRKISEITRADVDRFKREVKEGKTAKREKIEADTTKGKKSRKGKWRVVKGGPIAANRCLALLSKMFNLAEAWDLRPDGSNPTRHVAKYQERKVERFLSNAEFARLGAVLEEAARAGEHASVVAAIRLLILTGARRDEILSLRWEHVDFERGCLCLPDSKTGAKTLSLGAPALELLAGLPRIEDNPYVLPGARPGRHYVGLGKAWRRLRAKATVRIWADHPEEQVSGLVESLTAKLGRLPTCDECRKAAEFDLPTGLLDVRLHDLRHSYASMGAGLGESLHVIGALLGHRDTATTQRYAHLSDDPVRAAADRISGHLAAAMAGKSGAVVPLRSGEKPGIA